MPQKGSLIMKWVKGIFIGLGVIFLLCIITIWASTVFEWRYTIIKPRIAYTIEGFNTQDISSVKILMQDIAKKWNLRLDEDLKGIKYIFGTGGSSDQDSFFISLHLNDGSNLENELIFIITRISYVYLALMVFDDERISSTELDRLINEVKNELENRFDLEFHETDITYKISPSGDIFTSINISNEK